MKETRYFFVPDAENQTELPTDEAMHAMRVLRLKSGLPFFRCRRYPTREMRSSGLSPCRPQ